MVRQRGHLGHRYHPASGLLPAPLANILSLKYDRPGLIGYLLNFGSVIATVGGQEFRFDGVFDPVGGRDTIMSRYLGSAVTTAFT